LTVLSQATDLGVGRPPGNELVIACVSMRFGQSLGLGEEDLRELLAVALLRWIGCTSHAHELASVFPDEIAAQARGAYLDFGSPLEMVRDAVRHAGGGRPPLERARTVAWTLANAPKLVARSYLASCEVGASLARALGLDEGVQRSLGAVFERWDGKGWPTGLEGEAIPSTARIVNVVQDAVNFTGRHGLDDAIDVLGRRAGGSLDPRLAKSFTATAAEFFREIDREASWGLLLDREPTPWRTVPAENTDEALAAVADFADLKDPHTAGHSRGVARLAADAAQAMGLSGGDVKAITRAGLLHDLGRVGVPNGIWEKQGPLSEPEWERVRLHPYFVERATARCSDLARYGQLAASHHERLDGSGYHRAAKASDLSQLARLLAAADAYQAMTEHRAHRPALDATAAKARLREEVRAGRIDGHAADAVLAAAGHRVRRTRRNWPAGLSSRELEVLRLAVRGASNRQIAERLHISERTVEHHLSHGYTKMGVTSRAAAALFATQNDLLQD
jgi:HD-GYP domain-containing protein (c-di-GMP phosphodiesterase class II)